MSRMFTRVALTASLVAVVGAGIVYARGFGGGGFRGGGFSGGGFRGGYGGGFHGSYGGGSFGGSRGGYGGFEAGRGGYGGEMSRGGYGGESFGRTPSFSSAGTFDRSGSEFRGYNPYAGGTSARGGEFGEGAGGARYGSGYTSGSYTGARGGTVDYGAAGRGLVGPEGGAAGRGVAGVQVTTPGGRSFTDVGRAGGAVGPGGAAVGARSNVAVASGPRGTAVEGSRGVAAVGPGGAAGYRAYGAAGYRPHGYNAYAGYHSGWVHGYWNGHNDAAWGWRGPYWGAWGLGAGLGWGLASWGFGSALYDMGYMPYYDPYYVGADGQNLAGPYNYSQPIDTVSAPASEEVTSQAVSSFDSAREAFHQGNYDQALQLANEALTKTPNDTALHEFRALCLFALKQYDQAAAALYAVLSVGPGWDWATLISLYPDVETYTAQLRALEEACQANPQSAPDRFVLAYQYLTQGHTEAAVAVLKHLVALKPDDSLSAKLLRQLSPPATAATEPAPATTTPAPADTQPPQGATLTGTWTAKPSPDSAISLAIQPDGKFTWGVTKGGKTQPFSGKSTYGDGLLTLAQDNGPVLVGRVSWTDASHMTFRIAGDGPEDPGLSFSRE